MNKLYTLLLLLFVAGGIQAQTVSSSCTGPDSLLAKYDFDATKLAIRNLYTTEHADTSQILVDPVHKTLMLDALIAVHQAHDLPARDEVVDFFNVHALSGPLMNSFIVYCDTTYDWVKNWELGIDLTENEEVDNWVDSLGLSLISTPEMIEVASLGEEFLKVHIETSKHLNLKPLLNELSLIDGVVLVEEDAFSLEIEKDITYEYNSLGGFTELAFRYAWDDCINSCIHEHVWTFRIFDNDCSVMFLGDSGDPLPVEEVNSISRLSLFPNPTADRLSLNLVGPQRKDINVYLFDSLGKLLDSQEVDFHNGLINLDFSLAALPVGVYFITLENDNQVLTERILKK